MERLEAIYSVSWRIDNSGVKNLQELYRRIMYAVRIEVNRFSPAAKLWELEGRTDVRGDRKSGANGCQRVSWSEALDGKELRGALGGKRNLPERIPVF